MTDSDDTDALILIPPDFFVVHSTDSEESISRATTVIKRNCLSKIVYDSIKTQINSLESRLSLVESNSDASTFRSLDDSTIASNSSKTTLPKRRFVTSPRFRRRFNGLRNKLTASMDNLRPYDSSSVQSTPQKPRHRPYINSLPATPSTDYDFTNQTHSTSPYNGRHRSVPARINLSTRYDPSGTSYNSLQQSLNGSKAASLHDLSKQTFVTKNMNVTTTDGEADESSIISSPGGMNNDKLILNEIDTFLKNVKVIQQHMTRKNQSDDLVESVGPNLSNYKALEQLKFDRCAHVLRENEYKNTLPINNRPKKQVTDGSRLECAANRDYCYNQISSTDNQNGNQSVLPKVQETETKTICDNFQQPNDNQKQTTNANTKNLNSYEISHFQNCQTADVSHSQNRQTADVSKNVEQNSIEQNVNSLLKQIETKHNEIKRLQEESEQISKQIRTQQNDNESAQTRNFILQTGYAIQTVPDKGYGMRAIMHDPYSQNNIQLSSQPRNVPKIPVEEEPFSKRYAYSCGTDPNDNKNLQDKNPQKLPQANSRGDFNQNDGAARPRQVGQMGNDIRTVPDLGYGMRDIMHGSNDRINNSSQIHRRNENDSKIPVREKQCTKEHSYICGDSNNKNAYDDTSLNQRSNYETLQQSAFTKSMYQNGSHSAVCQENTSQNQEINQLKNKIDSIDTSLLSQHSNEIDMSLHSPHSNIVHANAANVLEKYKKMAAGDSSLFNTDLRLGDNTAINNAVHHLNETQMRVSNDRTQQLISNKDENNYSKITESAQFHFERQMKSPEMRSYISLPAFISENDRSNQRKRSPIRQKHTIEGSLSLSPNEEQDLCSIDKVNLPSLAQLWGNGVDKKLNHKSRQENVKLDHKLEEERFRRQHCERLIEALQARLLESQEKLAVAIKIDTVKDQTISHLRDACLTSTHRLGKLQTERDESVEQLDVVKKNAHREIAEANKRAQQFEHEMSTALEIAKNSQTQTKELHVQKEQLQQELERFENGNKTLVEKLQQLEKELSNNKKSLTDTRNTLSQIKKESEAKGIQLKKLSDEKSTLQQKLSEEQTKNKQLESQKKSIQSSFEQSKENEKKLQTQLQNQRTESERAKTELRAFYQRQVEQVVKDKLQEFESQLEKAENALQNQIKTAELNVATAAARYIQEAVEKHNLEIQLLETRHTEELRSYSLRLAQSERENQFMKAKLQTQQSRKTQLAKQLHSLMENQWREALRILTNNGKSPASGSQVDLQKPDSSADIQRLLCLNLKDDVLKSESEISLASKERPYSAPQENPTSDHYRDTKQDAYRKSSTATLRDVQSLVSVGSETSADDTPFTKDGQITYRQPHHHQDTPVTTRQQKAVKANDLQKYIKILLDKTPGNPIAAPEKDQMDEAMNSASEISFTPSWQPVDEDYKTNAGDKTKCGQRCSKPPWK